MLLGHVMLLGQVVLLGQDEFHQETFHEGHELELNDV